jgi:hypothetical protein
MILLTDGLHSHYIEKFKEEIAQHSVPLTLRILRRFQAFSHTLAFSKWVASLSLPQRR